MSERTTAPGSRTAAIAAAAERLANAARTGRPTGPIRDLVGESDQQIAYEVQAALTAARLGAGATIVGRKIGLTSPAVQQQLGVHTPDTGILFSDMAVPDGATVPPGRLLQPKVEAEVAFVLATDLVDFGAGSALDAPITAAERAAAAAAVGHAVAALEIVDSRIGDWDILITDTIADNASSGLYVLGATTATLADFAPIDVTMTLAKNGEPASSGSGAACLGDPLNALAWLARTQARLGAPLRAGELVLSGALGAMVTVTSGDTVVAELSTLGRVGVTFA
jgi:2-keto-4-pentenoate hydratase